MSNIDLFKVYKFDNKIRCGNYFDGGYVIGDLNNYDCYISAGVSVEESFSRDFINRYKMNEYNSFAFDGTIDNYPYEYTKKVSFIKKNIKNIEDDDDTNLSYLMNKYNNIFLKMDIESWEYAWILNADVKHIKQMVIEFHGITGNGWGVKFEDKMKCIRKLNQTHYIIHAHGNNWGPVYGGLPDTIELTYINKNCFNSEPELNTQNLPIVGLDYPNKIDVPDVDLNFYPFRK